MPRLDEQQRPASFANAVSIFFRGCLSIAEGTTPSTYYSGFATGFTTTSNVGNVLKSADGAAPGHHSD